MTELSGQMDPNLIKVHANQRDRALPLNPLVPHVNIEEDILPLDQPQYHWVPPTPLEPPDGEAPVSWVPVPHETALMFIPMSSASVVPPARSLQLLLSHTSWQWS